jgi:hypothetical protein
VILLAVGGALAVVLLLVFALAGGQAQQQTEDVSVQRDDLATTVRQDATTTAALCAAGGDVARALDTAGLCAGARAKLADPIVAAQDDGLTEAQIQGLVDQVQALQNERATALGPDELVALVLARFAADPSLRGVSADQVRSIVAAMLAAQPTPQDGRDGQPGASFAGLNFERNASGACQAVVTTRESDGSTSTQRFPAGDGACPGQRPADPDPTVAPTTEPPAPEPTVAPSDDVSPPSGAPGPAEDTTEPSTGGGGLLGGLAG